LALEQASPVDEQQLGADVVVAAIAEESSEKYSGESDAELEEVTVRSIIDLHTCIIGTLVEVSFSSYPCPLFDALYNAKRCALVRVKIWLWIWYCHT
jgi:hypothetical protein